MNPVKPRPTKSRRSRSVIGDRLNTRSTKTQEPQQGLVGHLVELRTRLLRIVFSIFIIFLPLAFFANDLYAILAMPLLDTMPQGTSMIATEVASPFLTPFKFALVLSVFLGMPVILYHFWTFI
ncbi:MAG TPA: hypothetical protein ENJ65_01280, partial [Candidatus Tenderia electrophaga]|nr:hypothetical protein [Candidatus Tenderia electrophaga]